MNVGGWEGVGLSVSCLFDLSANLITFVINGFIDYCMIKALLFHDFFLLVPLISEACCQVSPV